MGIAQNIRALREMAGITQRELADKLEVTDRAVSAWENGVATPRLGTTKAIADVFHISISELWGDALLGVDSAGLVAESPAIYTATTKVPLFGRIAAGKPIAADRVEDSFWVPPEVLQEHPRAFYLRVEGESMNRVIPDGSLALVDPDCDVRNGDIGALHVNGHDATIKRVMRGATKLMLVPESFDPEFHDMVFDLSDPRSETVTIIGRVVWFTRPYEGGCL